MISQVPHYFRGVIPITDPNRDPVSSEFEAVRQSLGEDVRVASLWSEMTAAVPSLETEHDGVSLNFDRNESGTAAQLSTQQRLPQGMLLVDASINRRTDADVNQEALIVNLKTTQLDHSKWPSFLYENWRQESTKTPEDYIDEIEDHYGLQCEVTEARVLLVREGQQTSLQIGWTAQDAEGNKFDFQAWAPDSHRVLASHNPPQSMLPWGISWNRFSETSADSPVLIDQLRVGRNSDGSYTVKSKLKTLDGDEAGSFQRNFSEQNGQRIVYHESVTVEKNLQGKGVSKSLLRDALNLYDAQGVDSVRLSAGAKVGGYAWAKYGWELKDGEASSRLKSHINARLDALDLSESTRNEVELLRDIEHPKMIWALADLEEEVEFQGQRTKLGKALLLGSGWEANLSLHDSAARQRLADYLAPSPVELP